MDRCRLAEDIFEQDNHMIGSAYPEDEMEEEEGEDQVCSDNLSASSTAHVDPSNARQQTEVWTCDKHKPNADKAMHQGKGNVMISNHDTGPWGKLKNPGKNRSENRNAQKMATRGGFDRLNHSYNLRQRNNKYIR